MDDDLRMLLADHGSPDALANCIADSFKGMRVPVPVEEIAEAVGIVEVTGIPSASFEGILVTDSAKTKGTIAYNDGMGGSHARELDGPISPRQDRLRAVLTASERLRNDDAHPRRG